MRKRVKKNWKQFLKTFFTKSHQALRNLFSKILILIIFHSEAAPQRRSVKMMFSEISQNSQENTCARASQSNAARELAKTEGY